MVVDKINHMEVSTKVLPGQKGFIKLIWHFSGTKKVESQNLNFGV